MGRRISDLGERRGFGEDQEGIALAGLLSQAYLLDHLQMEGELQYMLTLTFQLSLDLKNMF